jgi:hypothetical protein
MKYKVLRSAAHNLAHSFASLMNYHETDHVVGHALRAAVQSGETELRADLLTGAAEPAALLPPGVRIPVTWYVQRFPHHVASHGAGMHGIEAARLILLFDQGRVDRLRASDAPTRLAVPFECTVQIVDDRGKLHEGTVRGSWRSDWYLSGRGVAAGASEADGERQAHGGRA